MENGATHFDDQAEGWDDPTKLERSRRTAALLREALPLTGTEHILDIGAGTGRLSIDLADSVDHLTVSDPSAGMIKVAARTILELGLEDKISAVRLDLTSDPLPDTRFDGAWAQLALHHVSDVDELLRQAYAVLRPGGWLAVVDLDHDPQGAFHAHLHAGEHDHGGKGVHDGFDRDSFADRLRAAGFASVEVRDAGVVSREVDGQKADFPMFLAVGFREQVSVGGGRQPFDKLRERWPGAQGTLVGAQGTLW